MSSSSASAARTRCPEVKPFRLAASRRSPCRRVVARSAASGSPKLRRVIVPKPLERTSASTRAMISGCREGAWPITPRYETERAKALPGRAEGYDIPPGGPPPIRVSSPAEPHRPARDESLVRRGIRERRLIGAASAELERERPLVHPQQLREQLEALAVVSGDHAGDGLLVRHGFPHAHGHLVPGPKPPAARAVLDLDRHRPPAEQVALLPYPWELALGRPTELPRQDAGERLALPVVAALVDEEEVGPGRSGLVVRVAQGQDRPHAGQVDVARPPLLDGPREGAQALAEGRAAAGAAADPPAWADRLAVAGLEVGARDGPVRHSATIASISTSAPRGSAAAWIATRAGGSPAKNSPYTSFTRAKSPMSER